MSFKLNFIFISYFSIGKTRKLHFKEERIFTNRIEVELNKFMGDRLFGWQCVIEGMVEFSGYFEKLSLMKSKR